MNPGDTSPARKPLQHDGEPLFLQEALRFLDDASSSWRALAARWLEAGNGQRAADAMKRARQCETQRAAVLAALERHRTSAG